MRSPRETERLGAGRAGGLLSYFTRHATAANLIVVMVLIAGLAAVPRLRTQYFPDIVVPEVNVSVVWSGAGAAEVDGAIVAVLEPALRAVEGATGTSATAARGRADLEVSFEPGWDISRAVNDIETAIAAASGLPDGAETPEVRRRAWRDRVTDVVISGPVSIERLGRIADDLVGRLYQKGITRATVRGLADPEIRVEVPLAALVRHGLSLTEIADAIGAASRLAPAGEIEGANLQLSTGTERQTPEALAAIVLRRAPDGGTLTLGEVASVTRAAADRGRAFLSGRDPAVSIRVERPPTGDAIAIQREVEAAVEDLRPTLPQGVAIDLMRTRSEDIAARLRILVANGATGLALVLALLFLFLNARTAFWVAAGIPVAMLAAIAFMQATGQTLNMISLFALIMTLGIVVDDAIVVGEHIDHRARGLGEPPLTAAETGVRRMAAPVLASTATTIIAFLGLAAISGTYGALIADIPVTVAIVLLASLMEAFFLLPNHMARALAKAGRARWYDWPSRNVNRGFAWVRDRLVRPLVTGALHMRYAVLAAAVALLSFEVGLFLKGDIPWRFFNSPEQGAVTGNFALRPGATRADTRAYALALQDAVQALARDYEATRGTWPLRHVVAEVGAAEFSYSGNDTRDPDLLGTITIELIDADLRPWSSYEFLADLQARAPVSPYLDELSFRGARSGPAGEGLTVKLSGADPATLKPAAEALKTRLAGYPEVSALEDSLPYGTPELILDLTPQGQALGFRTEDLGRELRARLSGVEAASFAEGSRTATVRVELQAADRRGDFAQNTRLRVPGATGSGFAALSDIAGVTVRSGFASIARQDGQVVVSVNGDLSDDDPARAAAILAEIRDVILPDLAAERDITARLAGQTEDERSFLSDALLGLAAALAGIYAVLAWIFASWWRPLVVMAVIPFGLVGALHGHWSWGVPLSMFSVVGMIGMAGIIVNDAIVLVDAAGEAARTRAILPAIVEAVAGRLRAVFLTTATTVAGLTPLLFETSRQAQFLKPAVITLCYGLGFGMVLVLIVVPVLLAIEADIAAALRSFRRGLAPRSGRLRRLLALAAAGIAILGATATSLASLGMPILQAAAGFAAAAAALLFLIGWTARRRPR